MQTNRSRHIDAAHTSHILKIREMFAFLDKNKVKHTKVYVKLKILFNQIPTYM